MTSSQASGLHVCRPCGASWEEMSGDDRTRHCARCDRDVHDLTARTSAETEALVASSRGARLCVRVAVVALGVTSGCAAPAQNGRAPPREITLHIPPPPTASRAAPDGPPLLAAPAPAAAPPLSSSPGTTTERTTVMGCLCAPGDPLCSCL